MGTSLGTCVGIDVIKHEFFQGNQLAVGDFDGHIHDSPVDSFKAGWFGDAA
jgi:hypothetical protein